MQAVIPYCNSPGRDHSNICRGFSRCGDGVVTWGEQCDPGEGADPTFDGCQRCEHLKNGFACAEPGVPCGRCDLDRRILEQSAGADEACPFCLNNKLKETSRDMESSPCEYKKCKDIKTRSDAKLCDDFVNRYCENLKFLGMSDPGCVGYTKQVLKFAVPRVSSNCTYRMHDIDINSEYIENNGREGGLIQERVAIIDCEMVDETETNMDNTPVFWHMSLLRPPTDGMYEPPDEASVVSLLEELEQTYGKGGMVSLTDMQLEHFYEFQSTNLHDNGSPLRQFYSERAPWWAMLAVNSDNNPNHNWNKNIPDSDMDWNARESSRQSCRMSENDHNVYSPFGHGQQHGLRITPLPPCQDATQWAVKAKALEYKFRGVHEGHIEERFWYGVDTHRSGPAGEMNLDQHSMYKPLKYIDPSKFKPTCIPRKNHFVGMVSVSRTVDARLCWGDGCPAQARGQNAVAQKAVFHSFIPQPYTPSSNSHCDRWCCQECYNADGSQKSCSNSHCTNSNELGGPDGCCAKINQYPPMKVEDALANGGAKIVFGNRLFQKGCTDGDCEFRVEHCTPEDLTPAILAPNATAMDTAAGILLEKISNMNEGVNTYDNLTQAQFEVTAASMAQGYSDTLELFEKMVTMTTVPQNLEGIEDYCPYDWWNETAQGQSIMWKNDPCCNWELRRVKCCVPKDVLGAPISVIGSVDMDVVRSSCRTPDKVQNLLKDVSESIRSAKKCAADLDDEVGSSALDSLWEFREKCEKKIGYHGAEEMDGKGSAAPMRTVFAPILHAEKRVSVFQLWTEWENASRNVLKQNRPLD